MRRKKKPSATVMSIRFNPPSGMAIGKLATDTGWSMNVATNALIELGAHALDNNECGAREVKNRIWNTQAEHAIRLDADKRIAALRNKK